MTRRQRWLEFRDRIDRTAAFAEPEFRDLLARLVAERDPWLQRASAVHLVRGERELLTDAQLAEVAGAFGGKIARFISGVLIRRRLRRDPNDAAALRDASAYDQAWLRRSSAII